MNTLATTKQIELTNNTKKANNLGYRAVLGLIATAAVCLVAGPLLLSMYDGTFTGAQYEIVSHITRSSAFAAYILIWGAMLAGLSITSKAARKRPGVAWSFGVHRFTTLLGLGFAGLHGLSLLGDPFMGYTMEQVLVPFGAGTYKPQWIGLGQVALYALAVVAFSFYLRNRIGVRTWRLIHSLSFALFLMALIHGLQTGSDSGSWWATALYWTSSGSIALGSVNRIVSARKGQSKQSAGATGLIAVAGKAQVLPAARVLQPVRVRVNGSR